MKFLRLLRLNGKKVFLGPLFEKHFLSIIKWLRDPDVIKFMDFDKTLELDGIEKKWKIENVNEQNDLVFSICIYDTEDIIGVVGLHDIDYINKTACMGFFIGRKDLWNKGYGTEAQIIFLSYIFNVLNLNKIFAKVHCNNLQSKYCLEKCGYKQEDIIDRYLKLSLSKKDFIVIWKKYIKKYFFIDE